MIPSLTLYEHEKELGVASSSSGVSPLLRPWVRFLPGRSNDGFLHSFGLFPQEGRKTDYSNCMRAERRDPSSEREEEGLFWLAVEAKGEAKGKSAKGLFPLLLVLRLLYLLRLRFDFPRKRSPLS